MEPRILDMPVAYNHDIEPILDEILPEDKSEIAGAIGRFFENLIRTGSTHEAEQIGEVFVLEAGKKWRIFLTATQDGFEVTDIVAARQLEALREDAYAFHE